MLVTHDSSASEKIRLFRSLFVGREDVYATRWTNAKTGRSGWGPAVRGGYYTDAATDSDLLPMTDQVIERHLLGTRAGGPDTHVGLYPMLRNDTCRLLVCDFDDGDWKSDAAAYADACRNHGIEATAEISRSGEGAHVWIFFAEALPAHHARSLGSSLLREAMAIRQTMSLSSYDRFFPSQDLLPRKSPGRMRLGNLIALPLQGTCRRGGTTVFADPRTWVPYEDQFAHLSKVTPLSSDDVAMLGSSLRPVRTGPVDSRTRLRRPQLHGGADKTRTPGKTISSAPASVIVSRSAMLSIPTDRLPSGIVADLKHAASIPNPEFYRRQAQRFSTFGTPRFVYCFEHDETELRLPRGLLDSVRRIMKAASIRIEVADELAEPVSIDVSFRGELTTEQRTAASVMESHESGVLVAPPGSGKTVIACALIAERGVRTAVIVNRAELAGQWRERLIEFLDIDDKQIGQYGAGRRKLRHVVDIFMLQSVTHRSADPTLLNEYGLVIVDECHSLGAAATEAAIRQVAVKHWLGLTATPYRADQMDDIITMQCGPVRHTMTDSQQFGKELVVHASGFQSEETGADGPSMQAIYTELAADEDRNQAIAQDALDAYRTGRNCLILSNRVDHVEKLADILRPDAAVFVLHGRLHQKERRQVRTKLAERDSTEPFVLVAIDKVAGEGFDLPSLDTLFLASPIAFKGRIVQQLGRISRSSREGDVAAQVHDYRDSEVPFLERMFQRRRRMMTKLGFAEPERLADDPTKVTAG